MDYQAAETTNTNAQEPNSTTFIAYSTNLKRLISDLQAIIQKGFQRSDGPFVRALDTALASFNVEQQAYYSGTFVGNHVHKCLQVRISSKSSVKNVFKQIFYLQPKNIDTICKAIIDTAETICPTLSTKAEKVSRTFTQAFTSFAKCHNIYNRGYQLSEDDIHTLGR